MTIKEYQKNLTQELKKVQQQKADFNKKMSLFQKKVSKLKKTEEAVALTKELLEIFSASQVEIKQLKQGLKTARAAFETGQNKLAVDSLLS